MNYIQVPVAVAREIADKCEKSMVVILAYDPVHELTHCTTYGRDPQDKRIAANFGEACTKLIGGDPAKREAFEDFRTVDASQRAAEIERAVCLLAWFIGQCIGDSGTGAVHWEQFAEFNEAAALVGAKRGGA